MLLKFASMFLANIFYNSKAIFKLKKRDARLSHFQILLSEVYDIYLKINSSATENKLRHSTHELIIHLKFLKYLSLLLCQRQNDVSAMLG